MLTDRETTIAYHCPFCGLAIISSVNIFSINADMLRLKCSCGKSELVIQITKNKKVRLSVPCLACPSSHSFTLSSLSFFSKDIFCLSCTMSGIDICFFGEKNNVLRALAENEAELLEMVASDESDPDPILQPYDDYGDDFDDDLDLEEQMRAAEEITGGRTTADISAGKPKKKPSRPDPIHPKINYALVEIVLNHIAILLKSDKLRCACSKGGISASLIEKGIILSCDSCEALHFIPCETQADAEEFLKQTEVVL